MNYWDEMMAKVLMDGLLAKPFDLLLGRKTYDIFAPHWPFVKNDPDKMNAMAKTSSMERRNMWSQRRF